MGSCISNSKNRHYFTKLVPCTGDNINSEDDYRNNPYTSMTITRKHIKQKKVVVDSRVHNFNDSDSVIATLVEKQKSTNEKKMIKTSLQNHFIFNALTDYQIDLIIEEMKFYTVKSNEIIFAQGSKGSAFFIVDTGSLDVIVNNNKVNSLQTGDSFGELALIHDTPRTATVKAVKNSCLWVLDRRNFRSILEELNAKNYEENFRFIESISLFSILSTHQKELLVSCLVVLCFNAEQKIVNENDTGELLYIIKEGNVVCTQKGKEIRKMSKGDYFGEQALIYGSLRTATVTAVDDVTCVALNREEFSNALGASFQQILYKNSIRIAFDRSEVIKKLSSLQKENIINEIEVQSFQSGQVIMPMGALKKAEILIILKGEIRNTKSKEALFQVFDIIGDLDVVSQSSEIYKEDYIAKGEVDIAHISSSRFFSAIGGDYQQVIAINEAINLLKRVQLFRGLSDSELQTLAAHVKIKEYEDDDTIIEQNNPGDSFFLIKSGKVNIMKDSQLIRTVTTNDYFGERSLLFDDTRSASVIARKKVVCWILYKPDFFEILSENLRKRLLERIELQDDTITLSDLHIVKTLGSGMFGNVFLMMHKKKHNLFALKTVDRRKIRAYELEKSISLEKEILLQLDHVLIVKLVKTYKDSKRLYLLMEYIRGMDLFDVVRELNLLKETDARFYIGCMFTIIQHLHEHNILYRDLKPENMVVDFEGYPRLIDFGTAKFIQNRTFTIVGTPHYMAPEVITGNGYGFPADY